MKHFLFLLLLSATTVQAQTHLLGIKGGFTSTNALDGSIFINMTKSRKGFTAGLTYEYITKGGFSLLADLLYSQRGYKSDLSYEKFPPFGLLPSFGEPTLQTAYDVLTPYNYIALPLKMGFNFGNSLYGFVNAGFVPALLVHAEDPYSAHNSNGLLTEQGRVDVTAKRKRFDIAILAEVGGGYKFQNGSRVFAAVSVQQSAYDASGGLGYDDVKHNGFALTCGFKWVILKRTAAGTKPAVEE